ncbi:MAG: DinB family protein [Fluviicola sp.]
MSTIIKPIFQIQRINDLENQLDKLKQLPLEQLTKRPNPKSWSPIEVAKHMIIAQNVYREKIENALAKDGNVQVQSEFKASVIPSFLIKRFPPKEGEVKFKMKTMKQFKPVLNVSKLSEKEAQEILSDLSERLKELKQWVETYRTRPISTKKFNSAIGAVVRFSIPEACEFILGHNERHFFQINQALSN